MRQHLCHALANDAFLERNAPALHPVFGFNPLQKMLLLAKASSPRTRTSKSVSKKHQPPLYLQMLIHTSISNFQALTLPYQVPFKKKMLLFKVIARVGLKSSISFSCKS